MKKYIIPVAAFIAGMAIVPSVFAEGDPLSATVFSVKDADALKTCISGEFAECVLSDDLALNSDVNITRDMVLNLNGHNITFTSTNFNILGGNVVFKGGTITHENGGSYPLVRVIKDAEADSSFTLEEGATLDGGEGWALGVYGTAQAQAADAGKKLLTVNIYGDLISTGSAFSVEGNTGEGTGIKAPVVNFTGTVTGGDTAAAMYLAGNANVNLNGATVTAGTGIVMRAGNLKINNSTVTATADNAAAGTTMSGSFTPSGAALQLEYVDAGPYDAGITVEANNSSLTSESAAAIYAHGDNASVAKSLTLNKVQLEGNGDTNGNSPRFYDANNAFGEKNATIDGHKMTTSIINTLNALAAYDTRDAAAEPTNPDDLGDDAEGDDAENPNTADTIATYLTIATVALLGLGATAFVAKKSNR